MRDDIALGGDFSSTGVTVRAVNMGTMEILDRHQIAVDEIAERMGYRTHEGMLVGPGGEYTLPGEVVVEGIETAMDMAAQQSSFRPDDVVAMSWSFQGHHTDWWTRAAMDILADPDPDVRLAEQLKGKFSCDGPTWKDASTAAETRQLNEAMAAHGRPVIVMAERFPGPQIFKRAGTPAYEDAAMITCGNATASYVITGIPSFSGPGDAAASGFVNLETLALDPESMSLIAADLHTKIRQVTHSGSEIGKASPYFQSKGFTNLRLYVGDQDNIKSGAYLLFGPDVIQISLGTSYTISIVSERYLPGFEGNFASNDAEFPYLLLLCKRMGSDSISEVLAMHHYRKTDFDRVSRSLRATHVGNDGRMALPWFQPEIIPYAPHAPGMIREGYSRPSFRHDIRAVIEGNSASMRLATERYLTQVESMHALSFAGGAAQNPDITQIWINMFGLPGYFMEHVEDAAAIGAALTAMADHQNNHGQQTTLSSVVQRFLSVNKPRVVHPDMDAAGIYIKEYLPMFERFEGMHAQGR